MNKHPKGATLAYVRLFSISTLLLLLVSITNTYAQCPVTIGTQPSAATACAGGNININVLATNATTYQWEENTGSSWAPLTDGGVYSGTATATLQLTAVTAGMTTYSYRCTMVDACSVPLTSDPASITVDIAPNVLSQPKDASLCPGDNATFSFKAEGAGLVYQWQENAGSGFVNLSNTGAYSGTDTRTLGIAAITGSMTGYTYQCVVTGTCTGTATTNVATLTIGTLPAVTTQPITGITICEGSNTSFTVAGTGTDINYQWQVSTDAGANWNNISDGSVYTNTATATLGITGAPLSVNGYEYRCVISGKCTPSAPSDPAVLTINGLPKVTTQPSSKGVCDGSDLTFDIVAAGAGLTYQWEINTGTGFIALVDDATYAGSLTNSLAITGATAAMHGYQYHCVVSGTCTPPATSNAATLNINLSPTIVTQPVDQTVCAKSTTTFSIHATGQVYPNFQYQWQVDNGGGFADLADATLYNGVNTSSLSITGDASINKLHYRCVVSTGCGQNDTSDISVLTVLDLPNISAATSSVSAPVCPDNLVTYSVTAVGTGITYQWQVDKGSGYTNVPQSSSIYSGSLTPVLKIVKPSPGMNNYLFRCVVTGTCTPEAISPVLKLEVYDPGGIVAQSGNVTTCESGTTSMSVTATGTALKYQWQKKVPTGYIDITNLPPYSGTTTATLTFTGVPTSVSGETYRCVVTETLHCNVASLSSDMSINVTPRPESVPPRLSALPAGSASFSVANTTGTFQWQENHNGLGYVDLIDAAPYSGVTTNTLVIDPLTIDMNNNTYRCIVSGPCAPLTTISKESILIVDPLDINDKVTKGNNHISIYPNPVSTEQKLNISFEHTVNGKTDIKIIDKMGQLVRSATVNLAQATSTSIDVNGIASGIYTIQIANNAEKINTALLFSKQ